MPIYEYQCDACGKAIEMQQKMSDPPPTTCEACGKGPMTKLMSRTSFILKGGGWYTTDFKGGGASKGAEKPADTPAPPSTDGTPKTAESPAAKSGQETEAPAKPADHKTES